MGKDVAVAVGVDVGVDVAVAVGVDVATAVGVDVGVGLLVGVSLFDRQNTMEPCTIGIRSILVSHIGNTDG